MPPVTVAALRAKEFSPIVELEIPYGPCASFDAPGGQRYAVYEFVRPEAAGYFTGRVDEADGPVEPPEAPR